jgi:glycosyltransferase involved in cell wall biosynthesis
LRPRYDVAIHAPRAGPLFADPPRPAPGGAEVQMHYLATTLARLGLRVSVIAHEAEWLPQTAAGVDIVHAQVPDPAEGRARELRAMVAPLAAADAGVYVQRSAGSATGVVAAYARARRRKFILSTSWDGDLTLTAPIGGRLARTAYRLGRRFADVIVVQTDDQLSRARTVTRRPLRLIRSFAEVPPQRGAPRTTFLWIGRIIDYKDPLAFVELARSIPEARFTMVADTGDPSAAALVDEVRRRATGLQNLELLDPMPRERLLALYEEAVAVVNTSSVEGFPNTFMEGWARGAPALSLRLDPDTIVERHEIGRVADGSIESLASAARELWAQRDSPEVAARARAYVEREHSPAVIGERWAELITELS